MRLPPSLVNLAPAEERARERIPPERGLERLGVAVPRARGAERD